jgi:AAA+ ATPase superfamily predicted ATPase
MGCGGSKKGKKEKIDMTMEETGNADIDALFTNFTGPLTTLAEVANSLKKAFNRINRRTHAYLLHNCTLDDSITAMMYGLSGLTNGNIDEIELKIVVESPYIKISKHHVKVEAYHEIIDAWNHLVEKLIDCVGKMTELPGQIMDLVQEAAGIQDRAKAIAENLSMNPFEVAKMIRKVAQNLQKIAKAKSVLEETKKLYEQLFGVCTGLHKKFGHDGWEKIHHIGKEIHKAGVKDPREVIVQFWPDKPRVNIKFERPRKPKQQPHH